jgi:hypothetical protein
MTVDLIVFVFLVVRGNSFKLPFESTETFCAIFGQESGNRGAISRQRNCLFSRAKFRQESSSLRAIYGQEVAGLQLV